VTSPNTLGNPERDSGTDVAYSSLVRDDSANSFGSAGFGTSAQ